MISDRLIEENPGKDVIYFRNDYEDAVMKQVNDDGIYVKFKGESEFFANTKNDVVFDALIERHIDYIDKETYDRW